MAYKELALLENVPQESTVWVLSIEPMMIAYTIEGRFMPPPTTATLYHLAASGVFSRIKIQNWSYNVLLDWGRGEMQNFVAGLSWKGLELIEKAIAEAAGKKAAAK